MNEITKVIDLVTLCAGHDVSEKRLESLQLAAQLGVDETTLTSLRDALRISRQDTILLPSHRFENLSRGRGWARKGTRNKAVWGEREEGGYRVGPGKWIVGGNDGFSRKGEDSWVVKHVAVGEQTWTIAD